MANAVKGLTTGQMAEELGTTEMRIQELIRRGKIVKPQKVRGKRVWFPRDQALARAAVEQNQ